MPDESEAPVMTCYRCEGLHKNWEIMSHQHKCQGCKKTLPWSAYDPILLGWLFKREKKRGFSEKREVYCDECKYPACARCSTRPWKPPTAMHLHDGQYVCQSCRYPPCTGGCGTPRPDKRSYSVFHMPKWTCADCKRLPPCARCSTRPRMPPTAMHLHDGQYVCHSCWYPPCAGSCGTPRPEQRAYSVLKLPEWTCEECKWRWQYTQAKAHLEQHGTYNKWIQNVRILSFHTLSEEKKSLLRLLPKWTDQ